jgi:hypothetical protein
VTKILGYNPVLDPRGPDLAASLSTYQRVLSLDRLPLDRLAARARTPARRALYDTCPAVLRRAGFDSARICLLGDSPVTYLAVGYSLAGFGRAEADLVPYRGRVTRGAPTTTLLYAHPSTTEALLFALDPERVRRWMYANRLADPSQIGSATDLRRWFATHLAPRAGQAPDFPGNIDERQPDRRPTRSPAFYTPSPHQTLRALAVDSGYSETSLFEYLFPYELAFAVHPNGARGESSIGALRTVLEQNLDAVVKRAVDNDTCLYATLTA